ncbi:MAG: PepSY domain-containing protein [Variibacter sp.]|nr:PepSY domain-containing protein [Variibacter sp.]
MNQRFLWQLHRWIFLGFAVPLAVVIVTGLILSFQPILQTAGVKPGSITLAQLEGYLAKHDPEGRARALRFDHFEKTLTIQGVGADGSVDIDLKSGGEPGDESWVSEWMSWARPVHEHFVYDLEEITKVPIVLVSTIGMLAGILVGVLLGLPRIRNTVSGWHKATAWFLLPLLILSPLTGVFMALRVTFSGSPERVQPAPILSAIRMLAQKHDLSGLQSLRPRGGRLMAVVVDGGARHSYIVGKDALAPAPSNWPRTFHQGDFFGVWGGVMNVVLSLAFVLLLATGLWMWARRTFRPARRKRAPAAAVSPAE